MAYIHLFQTVNEFNSARTNNYVEPWLSYTKENSGLTFNKTEEEKLPETPLTFIAQENGTFKFSGSTTSNTLKYSLDNGETWVALAHDTNTPIVQSGNTIMWKGECVNSFNDDGIGKFISSGRFIAKGNVMSTLSEDNFTGRTSYYDETYQHAFLFAGCTGMTSAEKLILPVTDLSVACYSYMFSGCTSLTIAPKLPATTVKSVSYAGMFYGCTSLIVAPELPATTLLGPMCYNNMFKGCTSLTATPVLPATTLTESCYINMFNGCSSLTSAPELPAITLTGNCYRQMFSGCTNLSYIKCLATNISASNCTSNWVNGVAASGTFVKAPSMTSWTTGNDGIPANWTVQDA